MLFINNYYRVFNSKGHELDFKGYSDSLVIHSEVQELYISEDDHFNGGKNIFDFILLPVKIFLCDNMNVFILYFLLIFLKIF